MRRVITFLIAAGLLVAFAWWLAGLPGTIGATIGDITISLPTAWALLGAIVVFVLLYLLVRLVALIVRLPSRTRRKVAERARVRGDQAITHTLLALAGGDGAGAMKAAASSRALLGDTPQTLLLAAYAGRQAGQPEEAEKAFTLLAARKDAAFLGLRGLMQGAVARNDWDAARALSHRAEEVNPDAPWLRAERARLAVQNGDWKEALSFSGSSDQLAAIGTAASDAATDTGEARRLAKGAWLADQGFVPAALAYARRLREAGKEKRAQEVLRVSWTKTPHPSLAELALAGSRDATVRAWRVGNLASAAPNHPESYFLRAQAALEMGNLPQARREVEAAQAIGMDQRRVWRLLAVIAEREGDPNKASAAFRQAAEAEPDPAWRCVNCGTIHDEWRPKCDACGTVGQIVWGKSAATPIRQLPDQADALLP
jgi:HemY protein